MSDKNLVWPEDEETAKARIEQVQKLKPVAAESGLRFEAYLPPDLAEWVLDQVERGDFVDPSEAIFVYMQQAQELSPHDDLKAELLKRKLEESMKGPFISGEDVFERLRCELDEQTDSEPARWENIKQPD